jgi:hypothetical protein
VKRCTYLLPIHLSILREAEAAELWNYLSYSTFYWYLIWMEGGKIAASASSRQ